MSLYDLWGRFSTGWTFFFFLVAFSEKNIICASCFHKSDKKQETLAWTRECKFKSLLNNETVLGGGGGGDLKAKVHPMWSTRRFYQFGEV